MLMQWVYIFSTPVVAGREEGVSKQSLGDIWPTVYFGV